MQSPNSAVRSLPLSRFHQFADFPFHQIAFQSTDVADIKLAVQVIGLMQEGARQQIFSSLLEPLAVHVLCANGDLACSRHWFAELGNAEAAFGLGMPSLSMQNVRVVH